MSYSNTFTSPIPFVYVGIDTHTENYTMAAVVNQMSPAGEIITLDLIPPRKLGPAVKNVLRFIGDCKKAVNRECHVICGYEAGLFGYGLYRKLMAANVDCMVIAPSSLKKSSRDKKFKNDYIDSRALANAMAKSECISIYVPDEEDESIFRYIRMRDDHQDMVKVTKQRITAFVHQMGFHYNQGATWTQKHMNWIMSLPLSELNKETLSEYMTTLLTLQQKLEDLDVRIKSFAMQKKYAANVNKLRCFLGIEYGFALRLIVTIGDFKRFPTAGHFASFLGLTPTEHSSNEDGNYGSISKAGNNVLRKKLIEAVWSGFSRGRPGYKSRALRKRQEGCCASDIHYADKANRRLRVRFRDKIMKGKNSNVTATAVAREFSGFIWGMMTGHTADVIRKKA